MSADPVLIAFAVKYSKKAKRNYWYRIGKAYPHSKGSGLNVVLEALPINGRVVLLELNDWDEKRLLDEARRFGNETRRDKGLPDQARPGRGVKRK